ncbi:hypothetical protein [Flavobacterium defluvii]|uniref:Uncharacterized protein n=1 Tax=Flavobacterium defluvii TaxID=370979 RepID=A0A1M5UWU5_9FLAO|nr:hypothetical protein [Flavobacterium defluvii]SHH67404.1 hypothetical protein SAMN05443663_109186 [Flavobacterium defluvii]
MTPEEFVKGFYLEKKSLMNDAFNKDSKSSVSTLITELNLDSANNEKIKRIISTLLTDAFYTILLGLDGAASIGDEQHMYKILDENDNEISGGEIESYAYDYFHGNQFDLENE